MGLSESKAKEASAKNQRKQYKQNHANMYEDGINIRRIWLNIYTEFELSICHYVQTHP